MDPYDLLFGGLFDMNCDGVMDAVDDFIAYTLISEDKEEEAQDN